MLLVMVGLRARDDLGLWMSSRGAFMIRTDESMAAILCIHIGNITFSLYLGFGLWCGRHLTESVTCCFLPCSFGLAARCASGRGINKAASQHVESPGSG